ncbi:MAG: pitrilysin family protein [Patescibacteria group bacterium]|nr:pitrilysin family protein [Patescibacteria group bacterium]
MKKYEYFECKLANNLRVLHLPLPNTSSVYISLTGKVGRRAELGNEIGSAHFLEHLLFDGTAKRPTSFELSNFIEQYGGQMNGSTGTEMAKYWVKLLDKYTEEGFEYLSDIFFNSSLLEIDREKKIIAQEAKMKEDNKDDQLRRLTRSILYPNQAMGRTIFDETSNTLNMTKEVLVSYFNRVYVSQNFVLTIAGNIDRRKAISLAKKYFNQFQEGNEVIFEKANFKKQETVKIVHNNNLKQSKLSVNYRGYSFGSDEEQFVKLLNIILGQGLSSRLRNRIRNDLHLAYSIKSRANHASDCGFLSIDASTDESNIQKALDEIFKTISKLLENGITDEELVRAKNKLLSAILFNLENMQYYAEYFTNQLLLKGKIENLDKRFNKIQSASKKDLMRVANYIFSGSPKIVLLTKNLKKIDLNYKI